MTDTTKDAALRLCDEVIAERDALKAFVQKVAVGHYWAGNMSVAREMYAKQTDEARKLLGGDTP